MGRGNSAVHYHTIYPFVDQGIPKELQKRSISVVDFPVITITVLIIARSSFRAPVVKERMKDRRKTIYAAVNAMAVYDAVERIAESLRKGVSSWDDRSLCDSFQAG
jgi:hypothetical protein